MALNEMQKLARQGMWIWQSNCTDEDWPIGKPPVGITHGSDVEVMFHGGTTARGNLFDVIRWGLVTAFVDHGTIPRADLDTSCRLVWEIKPRRPHPTGETR